ncbi:MAG: hormogonium polysaccharide biosynthesis glycosyltransferase HpsP [Coleofasciculus sp. G3-WIS-01]|uniref:hormogonium polysaccharide biosynthesis glycosyltransferase HpsP n=1 Tax=Coleofasciculus sp. G3-WIS-01 TaxID=3069528 RepID=UPI0032F1DA1D
MRILQIVPSISLVYGGPSQMVLGLSKALANQGVDVTILTTDSNGDFGQAPLDVPLDKPVPQDGYQVRYFRCSPFRRYKFSFLLLRWLWQHAGEFDVAHIHALFSPVSTAAATVARKRNLPYILRPLGTLDPADLQKKRRLKQVYVCLWERANLAGAAGIHFTSEQEAKISQRFGTNAPDIVIPLGVTPPEELHLKGVDRGDGGDGGDGEEFPSYQSPIPNPQSPILLFMSRIDPKKGLALLIPALETLLAEGLGFQFILAGANPQAPEYERKIQQQIQTSPLSSHTTITGFVEGEVKAALLQGADLFVLPSYYENFGIAVAEAMVAGTPVVISDQVHIWQEVKGAEAGWVCGCDVASLTQTLREALRDAGEQKRRGVNGRDYALRHYSWDAIAQTMIEAYQNITDN